MPQPARQGRGRPAPDPILNLPARTTVNPALWEPAVARFLIRCRAKNLQPKTLDLYTHILCGGTRKDGGKAIDRLGTFRADHGLSHVTDWSGELLRAFEAELFEANLSAGTVVAFHRTLRTFLRFCAGEGIAVDPTVLTVEGPMRGRWQPTTFTGPEFTQLLAAATTPRNRMILLLFRHTGIRLEELTLLDIADAIIDGPGAPLLHVTGKMRKDRYVPLDTKTVKLSAELRSYKRHHRPGAPPEEPLFVGRTGTRLADTAVKAMLQQLQKLTGIHCHAHKFRHTYATTMLAAGADALELQQALGHTTLTMVSKYVHLDASHLSARWAALET